MSGRRARAKAARSCTVRWTRHGRGKGIGRTIAQGPGAVGAAVAVTARTEHELGETAALIERGGGRAAAFAADVTDRTVVERVVRQTEERLGPGDLLVNNAGRARVLGPLADADPGELETLVDRPEYGAVQEALTRPLLAGWDPGAVEAGARRSQRHRQIIGGMQFKVASHPATAAQPTTNAVPTRRT